MKVVAHEFLPRPPAFTPLQALAMCQQMVRDDPAECPHGKDMFRGCAHMTACNYGFANYGVLFAVDLWQTMKPSYKHHGLDKMKEAPAGALLFWTGGSAPDHAGHVGIADGKGNIYGTDLPEERHFGKVRIEEVSANFTLDVPAGWTFPYFQLAKMDNRPAPDITPTDDSAHRRVVKRLIAAEHDVIAAAKRGLGHEPVPELEAAYRKAIQQARARIDELRALKP